ncbi:MAG: flagellar basal-body rod protein FlgF [Caldilineaceae bacterium]|nr:flagellar basal-body rod protein FlgF [Caldilineaceae bacterium]HRJ43860.1 flagellar basal-body rod protein FlgF [Caldilineaceae bacterium]
MIRGIYTATSALRAATMHQTRLAHNITNLQTAGFKQILTTHQAYENQRMGEYNGDTAALVRALDGGLEQGLLIPEEIIDFSQGALQVTDRPLDLALEGDGFFRVQAPEGERYTRDGSFHRDGLGRLVNRDGHFVLNEGGQPLTLPPGPLSVSPDGLVQAGGALAGRLGLLTFANTDDLIRENGNLFRAEAAGTPSVGVRVQQGYLEGSNVDENVQMLEMMRIMRLYEASQRSLQTQDRTLGQALAVGEV